MKTLHRLLSLVAALALTSSSFAAVTINDIQLLAADNAVLMATENATGLTPDPETIVKYQHDLALIYTDYYELLADIPVKLRYVPKVVQIYFDISLRDAYYNGTIQGFFEIALRYGTYSVRIDELSSWLGVRLTFDRHYNTRILASLIKPLLPEALFVFADGYMGDSRGLRYGGESKYLFEIGWGDCPAGCTAAHTYSFSVNEYAYLNHPWGSYGDSFPRPGNSGLQRVAEGAKVQIGESDSEFAKYRIPAWKKDGGYLDKVDAFTESLFFDAITLADSGTYSFETVDRVSGENFESPVVDLVVMPHDYIWGRGEYYISTGFSIITPKPLLQCFDDTYYPWSRVKALGWVYVVGSINGAWFWKEGQGWLYTSPTLYPFLYQAEPARWLWSLNSVPYWGLDFVFWDFVSNKWVTLP